MRSHYPKLHTMTHTLSLCVLIAFKGTNFYILVAITGAGVVPYGGHKNSCNPKCRLYLSFGLLRSIGTF